MPTSISHLGGRARVNEPGRYRKKNNKNLMAQGLPSFVGMPQPLRNLIAKRVKPSQAIKKVPKANPTFIITVSALAGKAGAVQKGVDLQNAPPFGSVSPSLSDFQLLLNGNTGEIVAVFIPGVAVGLPNGSPVNVKITNVTKSESQTFIMTAKVFPAAVAAEAVDQPFDVSNPPAKIQATWSGTTWDIGDTLKVEIL